MTQEPLLHRSGLADPGEPKRIEVRDERFGRRVGVTFQPADPERLMLYVDGSGGHVVSATAFRALAAAIEAEHG